MAQKEVKDLRAKMASYSSVSLIPAGYGAIRSDLEVGTGECQSPVTLPNFDGACPTLQ